MGMPQDITPSPALCSIWEHLAWRALDESWDAVIAPILKNEDRIHRAAFSTYLYAVAEQINLQEAFGIFKTSFTGRKNGFWTDDHQFDPRMREVYQGYLRLVICESYWLQGQFRQANGWLPFPLTVEKWSELQEATVNQFKADLETWRRNN